MRILVWLILALTLIWALKQLMRGGPRSKTPRGGQSEEMVRDPQCGVYVPSGSSISRRIKGRTVHFCSKECEDSYRRAGNRRTG